MNNKIFMLLLAAMPIMMQAKGQAPRHSTSETTDAATYHFAYVTGSAGYSSLYHTPNVSTKGDFAWLAGAGYEFRVRSFWLSIGGQFQSMKSHIENNSLSLRYKGIDDQDKNVTYIYDINLQNDHQWQTVDVPLMLGYYYKGFYVGAGAKVGFSIGSTVSTLGTFNLKGDYPNLVGVFENVNYYNQKEFIRRKYDMDLRPQFSILGEIGYDLLSSVATNSTICHVLKIGFYFECGMRSIHPKESMEPLNINASNVVEASLNPYYLCESTEKDLIAPFYVGVKLTYLIGGNRNGSGTWHKGCQCYGK